MYKLRNFDPKNIKPAKRHFVVYNISHSCYCSVHSSHENALACVERDVLNKTIDALNRGVTNNYQEFYVEESKDYEIISSVFDLNIDDQIYSNSRKIENPYEPGLYLSNTPSNSKIRYDPHPCPLEKIFNISPEPFTILFTETQRYVTDGLRTKTKKSIIHIQPLMPLSSKEFHIVTSTDSKYYEYLKVNSDGTLEKTPFSNESTEFTLYEDEFIVCDVGGKIYALEMIHDYRIAVKIFDRNVNQKVEMLDEDGDSY